MSTHQLDPVALHEAIVATLQRRETEVPTEVPQGLSDAFAQNSDKQKQWAAFLRRAAPESTKSLMDVIVSIRPQLLGALGKGSKHD